MLLVTELFQVAHRLLDGCHTQNGWRIKVGVVLLLQCKIISKPLQSSAQGRKNGLYGVIQFSGETHILRENENISAVCGKQEEWRAESNVVTTLFRLSTEISEYIYAVDGSVIGD
jgi:hypothetical protein